MATASIEVQGRMLNVWLGSCTLPWAGQFSLARRFTPVEMERSTELLIAVIGLVFSGVGTAKTIWDWWRARRSQGVKLKVLLDDGAEVDLSDVDQQQLELEFERRAELGK
jgi:hypothetical protein